jgi:integrase
MTDATAEATAPVPRLVWRWPIDAGRYDTPGPLTPVEREALNKLGMDLRRRRDCDQRAPEWQVIDRLMRPLDDAVAALHWSTDNTRMHRGFAGDAVALVLLRSAELDRTFWGWSGEEWIQLIGTSLDHFQKPWPIRFDVNVRPYVGALAYLVGGFTDFHRLGPFGRLALARRVFGQQALDEARDQVAQILTRWGYRIGAANNQRLTTALGEALLLNRSPHLQDLATKVFDRLRQDPAMAGRHSHALRCIQKAVASLGYCDDRPWPPPTERADIEGAPPEWADAVDRWCATSTLTPKVRTCWRSVLSKAGRWLADQHPDVKGPADWTRQTCTAWIAAIDGLAVGDYVQHHKSLGKHVGKPLAPRTKAGYITATRTFFRDLQDWEWILRRFDPIRALATPRSIAALTGPDPRIIADDVWAKLLWAGLNLEVGDLPANSSGPSYPIQLIQAVTMTWLFSGQRSDEIARLRVGCIRWQHNNTPIPGDSTEVLAKDAVCLLDVPTHKTGTAFTKPVDPLLGQAIEAWQAIRPAQPKMLDRKTGEYVDFVFAVRVRRLATAYINETIIPALCGKAGVPAADVRGNITSHRARATIASQLYNATNDALRAAGMARPPVS